MSTKIPRDAQVIQAILKDMGIIEYEPRVINQLLEFIYRYVTTVLDDAKAYANHAKKKGIDLDDVKLAVSMQMEQSFTSPPPREILMEVARSKNSIPLPSVKPHCGIRLPPDCHCLAACNYKLKTIKKTLPKSSMALSGSTPGSRMGMLGAGRAVHRPSSPAVRVTTINAGTPSTPRPLVKINTGSTSTPANVPKIQIAFPAQPNQPAEKMDMDARGVKREREDDDYDAA
ncbi:transcription initiation factor TFIID subunit 9 [Daphnia magna]|uniref:Transcription initiation factor TFIID subunit 9 n=2 Tax=Daphnia magna TaxID=35525 RepID=A0A0P5UWN3_9CRUS|nr:transcription initiation factor TFIID subunit 9 [Daphnia magna]KAK4005226.1 hypothetical protein OUZ56_006941 [Daphnia magna]KZS19129.1 Transcription initiation factor TFIID subunit 9 [Daphnia magna]